MCVVGGGGGGACGTVEGMWDPTPWEERSWRSTPRSREGQGRG